MVALLLLLGCPPTTDDSTTALTGPFPDCRTAADCTDGSSCFAPDACNVGDYSIPTPACTTSEECGTALVCQPVPASCGVAATTRCVESCVTRGCADTEQCDAGSGVCVPWSCTAGYTCPAHTSCVGDGGDDNGCSRDTCTEDAACGADAFCVDARCYDTLGTCTFAVP